MADILLIQPPVRDFYLTAKRTMPYGLVCIAGALIDQGFDVEIFDALAVSRSRIIERPAEMAGLDPFYGRPDRSPFSLFSHFRHYGYSYAHMADRIRRSGAFLVGISSLFTAYSDEALEAARTAKKAAPECRVVLGGHHPTHFPEAVLAYDAVDYVVRGEGEVAMPLLAKAVFHRAAVRGIPGVGYRTGSGRYEIGAPVWMHRLEDFPPPAEHLVTHSFYRRKKKKSIAVTAGRGCPMHCSYCCVGASSPLPYRKKSVEAVILEISRAAAGGDLGFVDFEDEQLSMDRAWFAALLDALAKRFAPMGVECRAMNGLFPPTLDEPAVAAMKAAGFLALNLSLCTTAEDQLKRFSRPDVTPAFENALAWAGEAGLDAVGYIIAGAPYQTAQSTLRDLLYLAKRRVLAGLSIFYPAPGSPDYGLCSRLGVLPREFSMMRSAALPVVHKTSRLEAATLLRLSRILNFMKGVIDHGERIPAPAARDRRLGVGATRMETGLKLLAWFLNDGKIRGVTPEGKVFDHLVSPPLTQGFVRHIKDMRIRGCRR